MTNVRLLNRADMFLWGCAVPCRSAFDFYMAPRGAFDRDCDVNTFWADNRAVVDLLGRGLRYLMSHIGH